MGIKKYLTKKAGDAYDAAKKKIKGAPKKAKKKAKKAAKRRINRLKDQMIGGVMSALGAGAMAMLSNLFGGAGDEAEANRQANAAAANGGRGGDRPTPTDDPTIDLSGVGSAIALAMPSIGTLSDLLPSAGDYQLASLTVIDAVPIDTSIITEDGEPDYQISPQTTFKANIAEIGKLFAMMAALKVDVLGLQQQLATTNERLSEIQDRIDFAIDQNGRTRRANERRRDEADAEERPTSRAGVIAGRIKDNAKTAAKGFLSVLGSMVVSAVAIGVGTMMAEEARAAQEEDEEEEIIPEETIEEDRDFLQDTFDALGSEEGAQGAVNTVADTAATVGIAAWAAGALGSAAAGMGITGGATVAAISAPIVALAAPVAAVAGAAALGGAIGYAIYDNFLEDSVSEAAMKKLRGEEIDLGTLDSPEAIDEAYGGMEPVEALGDLLGEGMFDLAESPKEIAGWFRDNVRDMATFNELNQEYQDEYGTQLPVALGKVLGTDGLDSVMQVILNNVREDLAKDKEPQQSGVSIHVDPYGEEWKKRSVERPTPTRGYEIDGDQSDEIRVRVMMKDGSYQMMTRAELEQAKKDKTVDRSKAKTYMNEIKLLETKAAEAGQSSDRNSITETNDYDPAFNSINFDSDSSEKMIPEEPIFTLPEYSTEGEMTGDGVEYVKERGEDGISSEDVQHAYLNALPVLEMMASDSNDFLADDMNDEEKVAQVMPVIEFIGTGMQKVNDDTTSMFEDVLPAADHTIAQLESSMQIENDAPFTITDVDGNVTDEGMMSDKVRERMSIRLTEVKDNRDYIASLVEMGKASSSEYVMIRETMRDEMAAIAEENNESKEEEPSIISRVFETVKQIAVDSFERSMNSMGDEDYDAVGMEALFAPAEDEMIASDVLGSKISSTMPSFLAQPEQAASMIIPLAIPLTPPRASQGSQHAVAGNTTKAMVGRAKSSYRAADSFLSGEEPQT